MPALLYCARPALQRHTCGQASFFLNRFSSNWSMAID
jgi:hypothetical protein